MDQSPSIDPGLWVDQHGDYLYRFAHFRVRDEAVAEDLVQETLLAALQSRENYAGRGSERTWLTGILKHKIVDHFRKVAKLNQFNSIEGEEFEHNELFMQEGEWTGHWVAALNPDKADELGPIEWNTNPAAMLEQGEFWETFKKCLSPLPPRIASAFTMREVDGLETDEICNILGISANNLWVMLHRARTQLRRCLEVNWFRKKAG
jgi:RNA polymerase sigma-70 factor (ECF subfamily)